MRYLLCCKLSKFRPNNRNEAVIATDHHSIATDQNSGLIEALILWEDARDTGTTSRARTVLA